MCKGFQAEDARTGTATGPSPAGGSGRRRPRVSSTYQYTSVRDHALVMVRAVVEGVLKSQNLDAIFYPTQPRRAPLFTAPPDPPGGVRESRSISPI